MAWCENAHGYSLYLAVCTLIGSFPYLGAIGRLLDSWIARTFLLLQGPLLASTLLAVQPSLSIDRYIEFVKSFLVLLLIPVLIQEQEELKRLILIIAVSVGAIGLKFGGYGVAHSGVILINGYGGQMSDNNLVGLALAMIIPLCWYERMLTENKLLRNALLVIASVSIGAVIMTNSRGSSLALAFVFLCIVSRSRRKLGIVVMLALVAGAAVYSVRDQYVNRMSTIAHYEDERSAASRVEFAQAAMNMWLDHPLFGVGFGGLNFIALVPRYLGREDDHVVHNTYVQMLVDSGIFALLLYLVLLWGTILWLGVQIRKLKNSYSQLATMAIGLQISLIAFAIGGTFYSSQRYDLPYIVLLCCAAWELVRKNHPQPEALNQEPPVSAEIPASIS